MERSSKSQTLKNKDIVAEIKRILGKERDRKNEC